MLLLSKDTDITSGGRQSGKTYRQILRCMMEASMEHRVYFLSNSVLTRDYAFRMAMQMTPIGGIGKNGSLRQIDFPGGGFVKFVVDNGGDELRGVDGLLHRDHYLDE